MSNKLMECVPNISEGRDKEIIKQVINEVKNTNGVSLLDVDPGHATNRTVITFVGHPDNVIEAAFKLIKKASELINMEEHSGEHPRMGATDVCPLVPVSGMSMNEVIEYSEKLGSRVGKELKIPVYLYEHSAKKKFRKNLADIRQGEYENIIKKVQQSKWEPDFGSINSEIIKKSGNKLELKENKLTIFFNYFDLIENIKQNLSISDDDIICKSYDENKENLIKSYNQIIGINQEVEKIKHINVGLPQVTIELLETLNKNFYKSKIDLKSTFIAQRSILNNKTLMLGNKFQIKDINIKKFFKNEFWQSNNKIEELYDLKINKFIV